MMCMCRVMECMFMGCLVCVYVCMMSGMYEGYGLWGVVYGVYMCSVFMVLWGRCEWMRYLYVAYGGMWVYVWCCVACMGVWYVFMCVRCMGVYGISVVGAHVCTHAICPHLPILQIEEKAV